MTTPVLSATSRHYARRFSGGITPALASSIQSSGGGRKWFAAQLQPARVPDKAGAAINGWFGSLHRPPAQIFRRQTTHVQGSWEVMDDLSRWTVARRIHSTRQVNELMVDFWSNLLHVPLGSDDAAFWRVSYDQTIRRYALTSFADLLLHATTHPAMGLNLSNAVSTKDKPNENLGRELLELHTVGLAYTEADVKNSSRLLTGYRADVWWPKFRAFYDPSVHWTGPVKVLGFRNANSARDGRKATAAYLSYLAHHPLTANRLARRLCVRFVGDNPSAGLVRTVAKAYLRHGTAIKPTLLAMVDHPEFAASKGRKVRTPIDDYVATVRALGIKLRRPTADGSFANAMYWQYSGLGTPPYEWPSPDGSPQDDAAWTSAGRLLGSFSMHRDLAAGWWPTKQADFRTPASWFPPLPATLQEVVDHAGVLILGQTPGPEASQGIATLLNMHLDHRVTASESQRYWMSIQIVSSLLDSPTHLHR